MADRPVWIDEADVVRVLTMGDAIDVLDAAYRLQSRGSASNMRRAHLREGEAILHAVGGAIGDQRVAGTKTWIHTPGGASPLLIVFDLDNGGVRAVIEAFAMGQMRTAATSGLATRYLARQDAGTLAVLGTGKQSVAQAQAIVCERPITKIRLFGRDPSRRAACASRIRDALGVEVTEHATVADTVAGADVITAITRAAEPILSAEMLEPGQHINAVGSIVPSKREVSADLVGRCDLVVADSVPQARDDAGELRAAVDAGLFHWDSLHSLASVIAGDAADGRGGGDAITLFKAVGIGVSDVALGNELVRRVTASDTAPNNRPTTVRTP
jgi:alanine dehydrogenase